MKLILTLLLISITFHINAKPKEYGNIIVSEITSIYDADTFRVNIKGFPPIAGQNVHIRILGIDAPEIRGKCKIEKPSNSLFINCEVLKLSINEGLLW